MKTKKDNERDEDSPAFNLLDDYPSRCKEDESILELSTAKEKEDDEPFHTNTPGKYKDVTDWRLIQEKDWHLYPRKKMNHTPTEKVMHYG